VLLLRPAPLTSTPKRQNRPQRPKGKLKYREDITDGLENAPRELIGLLRGENLGKKLIRVSAEPKDH
jgi:hypothetical protein